MNGRIGKTLYFILCVLHCSESWISNQEFEEYLNQIDGSYAEIGTTPKDLGEIVTGKFTFRKNWHFAGFGEVPYLVIFYKRKYSKTSRKGYVELKPGSYCGGLRITVMRFITSCRCLNTWYHWKVSAQDPPIYRPWETDPYDIQARRIFVTAMRKKVLFEPDDQFELDTSDLGQCGLGKSPKIEAIVVKFKTVDVTQDTPRFDVNELLPWPPKPLLQLEAQPGSQTQEIPEPVLKGFLTSYGMASMNWVGAVNEPILNDFGEEIAVNTSAVNVGVREVPLKDDCLYHLNAKWNLFDDDTRQQETANFTLICFRVSQDLSRGDKASICGGAPGFPVLRDGTVHGLVVEPLDCDLGYVITLAFDHALQVKIEDVIDPSLLNVAKFQNPGVEPKDPNPLDKLYQYSYFWDLYGEKGPENQKRQFSRSSCLSPNFWILCIILLLSLF